MSVPKYPSPSTRQTQCRNCGGQVPHRNGPCPANGKTCNACHKQNHVAKVCRSKQNKYTSKQHTQYRRVNEIQSETTKREIQSVCSVKKSRFATIKVNAKTCTMMIDTGATVNVLDDKTHNTLVLQN